MFISDCLNMSTVSKISIMTRVQILTKVSRVHLRSFLDLFILVTVSVGLQWGDHQVDWQVKEARENQEVGRRRSRICYFVTNYSSIHNQYYHDKNPGIKVDIESETTSINNALYIYHLLQSRLPVFYLAIWQI